MSLYDIGRWTAVRTDFTSEFVHMSDSLIECGSGESPGRFFKELRIDGLNFV